MGKLTIRQQIEHKICKAIIKDALAAGYGLSLQCDGEEFEAPTLDAKVIAATLFDVDMAYLVLHEQPLPDTSLGSDSVGWVLLVFGNDDGTTVTSNWTDNDVMKGVLARALSIADNPLGRG